MSEIEYCDICDEPLAEEAIRHEHGSYHPACLDTRAEDAYMARVLGNIGGKGFEAQYRRAFDQHREAH